MTSHCHKHVDIHVLLNRIVTDYLPVLESIIPEMYNGAKELLKDELSIVEFVAMTTDDWSSRSTKQYMAVTLHWLAGAMNTSVSLK